MRIGRTAASVSMTGEEPRLRLYANAHSLTMQPLCRNSPRQQIESGPLFAVNDIVEKPMPEPSIRAIGDFYWFGRTSVTNASVSGKIGEALRQTLYQTIRNIKEPTVE